MALFLRFIYFWLCWVFVHALLIAVALLVEHRLQGTQASVVAAQGLSRALVQYLWCTGLVAPWHVGSFRTQDQTHVPCISKLIRKH